MLRWIAGLAFASLACSPTVPEGSAKADDPSDASAVPVLGSHTRDAAAASGVRELRGTLRYKPLPQTKSLEAYHGIEFTLESGAEVVALDTSDAVSHELLEALNGQFVVVTCTPRTMALPTPTEAYPVDPNGSPVPRAARCDVTAIARGASPNAK